MVDCKPLRGGLVLTILQNLHKKVYLNRHLTVRTESQSNPLSRLNDFRCFDLADHPVNPFFCNFFLFQVIVRLMKNILP